MSTSLTIECACHFTRQGHGARKEMKTGVGSPQPSDERGRVPRISRLMALALRLDELLRTGQVRNCAEIAELGHVTRARVSQIMSLLNLATDLQEAILFLPRTIHGRDPIILRQVLPIASLPDWGEQRRMWQQLSLPRRP